MHILKDHFENNLEIKGVSLLRFGFHETLNADDYFAILLHRNSLSNEICLKRTWNKRPGVFHLSWNKQRTDLILVF